VSADSGAARPGTGTAPTTTTPDVTAETTPTPRQDHLAAQLRRRRAAAVRCEPLGDGRRDPAAPLTDVDRWTSERHLHLVVGCTAVWLLGGRVRRLLDGAGVQARYDHRRGLWSVPVHLADDVRLYAERVESRFVTTEAVA
jgi:hypothetical protein